ncbi:regulatory protein GemA [Rhodoferax sp.]|uniref:regulatory protein GemA n=1 Tax=Rhodoferax sp. TaxID=50421 RepID=UPI00260AC687|nr:regulatory protein GemA [Rhodoferax sp.]MDD3938024.1 regulatory protein GemA [Rhodoferax sp.]
MSTLYATKTSPRGAAKPGKPRSRRAVLMGLVHKAGVQLGLDDAARRAAQVAFCGVESCKTMTDAQLVAWCWELKRRGAVIGIPVPAQVANHPMGPTDWQLVSIERAAVALGFDKGWADGRLRAFCARTVGVDAPQFLSRADATKVLTGLHRWQASGSKRQDQRPTTPAKGTP